jgi:WD40 repeat protein/DNA-binding SARP family transcriptional activator
MTGAAARRFGVLGPLIAEVGGLDRAPSAPRQRALLGLFLLSPGVPIPSERILDRLWGEEPPSGGVKTVGFHLSKLRDALEPDREKGGDGTIIRTTPAGYVLDVDPAAVDAALFERLLGEARAVVGEDPGKAASLARDALGLWRGPALADFAYEEFAQGEIRRLEELRLRAVETRVEADLALGRHGDLVAELERLIADHPLREGLRTSLMLALYRSGRQADALRAFEDARRTLAEELGIDPSRELRALEGRILEQDPALDLPVWAVPSAAAPRTGGVRNPYKGLQAFTADDADDFFGRAGAVAELVERVDGAGPGSLTLLVGPSGSGKSSVVGAGVVPALRGGAAPGSDAWVYARMYPGSHPVEELEVALLRSVPDPPGSLGTLLRSDETGLRRALRLLLPDDGTLLLVIDQFEELWSLAGQGERRRFLDMVAAALDDERAGLRVLATLRADFYGYPLADQAIAERIRSGTLPLTPMTADELEDAVAEPARGVGVAVDPGLVAAVVADLKENPGALPLLQYSLTEAFDRRSTDALTGDDYQAVGGLRGALGGRAAQISADLTADQRAAARQVMLRLVNPGEGGTDVRRRVSVREIHDLDLDRRLVDEVLDAFGRTRLLTFDHDPVTGAPTVEVAHEALLSEWRDLAEWIDTARGDIITHRRLSADAAQWEESGGQRDYLPAGSRFDLYEAWAAETTLALTSSEEAFLAAAAEHLTALEAAETARQRQELTLKRRSVRRLRWLVAVVSLAAAAAAVLSLFAVSRSREAEARRWESRVRELAADSTAAIATDPELSVLLALESARAAEAHGLVLPEVGQALHDVLAAHRLLATFPPGDAAVFADDDHVAVVGEALIVHSLSGAEPIRADIGRIPGTAGVLMAGGSNGLVVTLMDAGEAPSLVQIWEGTTGRLTDTVVLPFGTGPDLDALALSPDGGLLVTAGTYGTVLILDAAGGEALRRFDSLEGFIGQIFQEASDYGLDIDVSPDGSQLGATFFEDDTARLFDLATGEWTTFLVGHEAPTSGIRFLPGDRVVTTGRDGVLRIWDGRTGEPLHAVSAGVGVPACLDVSADGSRAAVGGDAGIVTIWDVSVSPPQLQVRLVGHRSSIEGVDISPDGSRVVSSGADGARVWDVSIDATDEVPALPGPGPFAFAPDGSAAAAARSGDVALLDAASGAIVSVADGVAEPPSIVLSIALGSNGMMATATHGWGDADGALQLWDTVDGSRIGPPLLSHVALGSDVVFSADGSRVAASICDYLIDAWWSDASGTSGRAGTPARIWSTTSGEIVFSAPWISVCGHAVAFDPAGRLLAVAFDPPPTEWMTIPGSSPGRSVGVWDLESRELVFEAEHPPWSLGGLAFSPDGRRLLTAGADGLARVWDVVTGDLLLTLAGHTGPVESAVFDASGSRIATGGVDGTVRLWDAATGQPESVLRCRSGWVADVAFDPGRDWVHARCRSLRGGMASAEPSATLQAWTLDLNELVAVAESRTTRSLTPEECAAYRFDPCPAGG